MTNWSRVSKLLGMLGSAHDGERLNAARLLQRALESDGASFGDLASRVESGGTGYVRTVTIEKRAAPNPAAETAHKLIERARHRMSMSELFFLQSIVRKADFTDGNYELTTPQADFLDHLDKRYVDRGMPMQHTKPAKAVPEAILDDLGFSEKPKPKPKRKRVTPDASEDDDSAARLPLGDEVLDDLAGFLDQLLGDEVSLGDEVLDDLGLGTVHGTFTGPRFDRHKDVKDRFGGLDIDGDDGER